MRKRLPLFAGFTPLPPSKSAGVKIKLPPSAIATVPGSPITNKKGEAENLDARSSDSLAMLGYWDKVDTICQGAEAMRNAGEKYLPKFPDETPDDYKWRLSLSKFTNVYRDVVEGLAARPFEAPVRVDMDMTEKNKAKAKAKAAEPPPKPPTPVPIDPLNPDNPPEPETPPTPEKPDEPDPLPDEIETFIENVDGAYNSITEYAATLFFQTINDAVGWIFVDYPNEQVDPDRPRSKADEAELGIRPFWSHVLARNVLEVRTALIAGNEVVTYFRMLEPIGTDKFVRIMYRDEAGARWELWKQVKNVATNSANGTTKWTLVGQGVFSIGIIPMVRCAIGRRRGRSEYYFPAMQDAADLQIELYWQESGLKHIKTLAAFPMLAGNGVKPPLSPDGKTVKPIRVTPMAALYAPPDGQGSSGTWNMLEPSATTLTFLAADVKETILQLRELGRNPLTAQSGNLTVITTQVAAKKGNSACQMWAIGEENALDIALYITALWYGIPEEEADRIRSHVFVDFDVDGENGEAMGSLQTMRDKGDLSQRTLWKEAQRRDVLSADFDADAEEQALLSEGPKDDGTVIDMATGRSIPGVKPMPGQPPAPGKKPGAPAFLAK